MLGRTSRLWLMTVAILVVPLGGVLLLLYGAGWLTLRKPLAAAFVRTRSFRK
jgi:hypothetical protein